MAQPIYPLARRREGRQSGRAAHSSSLRFPDLVTFSFPLSHSPFVFLSLTNKHLFPSFHEHRLGVGISTIILPTESILHSLFSYIYIQVRCKWTYYALAFPENQVPITWGFADIPATPVLHVLWVRICDRMGKIVGTTACVWFLLVPYLPSACFASLVLLVVMFTADLITLMNSYVSNLVLTACAGQAKSALSTSK